MWFSGRLFCGNFQRGEAEAADCLRREEDLPAMEENETPNMISEGLGPTLTPDLEAEQRSIQLKPGDVINDRFEVVKQLGMGGIPEWSRQQVQH